MGIQCQMGTHRGSPAPDEDAPVPFWPAKPLAVSAYAKEPTVSCCVCPRRINPRREAHYSQQTDDGWRQWCLSHGTAYGFRQN